MRLAVRKVVERVMLCGDIDNRYTDASAMNEGAKAHRRIQKAMGEEYEKEVSLSLELEFFGLPVVLHGRADGIIREPGSIVIDEIKTTALPLERLAVQRELHLGQAKCYAHMLLAALEQPPEEITIQLTYCQLESGDIQRHRFVFSANEIKTFFDGLMAAYGVWLRFERDWAALRNASIQAMEFPFERYRDGQRKLAANVYGAIDLGRRLYAQAPTGIGKTLSTLFPAVKAVGEGKAGKLFYLTAKTVTRAVAQDAVALMAGKGLRFKSVTLRAKEKICFCGETNCNPEYCEYAKGHYDRINKALLDLLQNVDMASADVIEAYAKAHKVCPHELSLDAAEWADLVICDYNHVFDPVAYIRRFFEEGKTDCVFLIDEAHNLSERVRDMYTEGLRRGDFTGIKRELRDKNTAAKKLRAALGRVGKHLLEAGSELGEDQPLVSAELDAGLVDLAERLHAAAKEWLAQEQRADHPLHKRVLQMYFNVQSFLGLAQGYGGHYAYITEAPGGDIEVWLYCLDPSGIIEEKLGLAKAAVLFSATLAPLPYYKDVLGGREEDGMIALDSPFDRDRLLLLAHCGISTRYKDRAGSMESVAEAIRTAVEGRRGNYIVYFPSYEYMRGVYRVFAQRCAGIETAVQQPDMDDCARAEFLSRFQEPREETLLGFCVLGGVFSEGIDLAADRLIGVIIVGVGLPKISLRQDLIRDYFERINGFGYDYAYVFPGMNKVLQAAGRVIRGEADSGMVLLIDSRFGSAKYNKLYPPHWAGMRRVNGTAQINELLEMFWSAQLPGETIGRVTVHQPD